MDLRDFIAPAVIGAGGYVSGLPIVKTQLQNLASKINSSNPNTGMKELGLLFLVAAGLVRGYMNSDTGDIIAYFLAGMGAGALADPIPQPQTQKNLLMR